MDEERHFGRGITLTDCSVAIFVSALLFVTIVPPLHSRIEHRKIEDTMQLLDRARSALLGYAAVHGYFPCPADHLSGGHEPPATDHATGACPTFYGFLPAAALGLQGLDSQGYAVDAWNRPENRIRYAVAHHTVSSVANAFTRTNGMRAAGIASLGNPALSLFHVCADGVGVVPAAHCGKAVTLVSTAPVVIWSLGANAPTGGTSVNETQNPNPQGGSVDRLFVSAVRNNAPGSEFDDIVTWIPMTTVAARLLAAGHLP